MVFITFVLVEIEICACDKVFLCMSLWNLLLCMSTLKLVCMSKSKLLCMSKSNFCVCQNQNVRVCQNQTFVYVKSNFSVSQKCQYEDKPLFMSKGVNITLLFRWPY